MMDVRLGEEFGSGAALKEREERTGDNSMRAGAFWTLLSGSLAQRRLDHRKPDLGQQASGRGRGACHRCRPVGPGTLTLPTANFHTAGTQVQQGLLIVAHPGALGTGQLAISQGRVVLQPGLSTAVRLPSLSLQKKFGAYDAHLDLTNNALVLETIDATNKAAKIAELKLAIASAHAGGTWTGKGLTSSTIPATPNTFLALAGNADLGYTTFRGQAVNANALLLSMARFGDATLDGNVDAFDLNLLAAHWQQPLNALWSSGDFTGDDKVDAFDLNVLAANWQFSGVALEAALEHWPALWGPVPEPATLVMLTLAGLPMLAVRRRRTKNMAVPGRWASQR
jgi:hypothetical protein